MPRYLDDPTYKPPPMESRTARKPRTKWDPVAQKMVRPDKPPTGKQLEYLRDLCRKGGVGFVRPRTRREAASMIDKRLAATRRAKRKSAARAKAT